MLAILALSSDIGSDARTSRFLLPLLQFFFPGLAPETYQLLHAGVRKFWHFAEYAILSLLWARALAGSGGRWEPRHIRWAMMISILWAILDEFQQAFVPSRHASAVDVGIDASGAVLGQAARNVMLGRTGRRGP